MLSFFCGFSLFSYVTLYVHWTVYYIILLTVYSVVQCCTTVYNVVQCTMLYSAQCCTVYSVQCCTVYSVQCWTSVHCCTVYSVQCCTVYNDEQCTVYNIVQHVHTCEDIPGWIRPVLCSTHFTPVLVFIIVTEVSIE